MRNKTRLIFTAAIHFAILIAAAQAIQAQVYGGRAIGATATTTINGTTTNYSAADTGQLPASGGDVNASAPSFAVNGFVRTGVLTASASGALRSSQAVAVVNDFIFELGGVRVQANRVTANAGCICCPEADLGNCSASTRVNTLVITDANGAQTIVSVSGQANQVVNLPGGLGTITINEQTGGVGGINVNGLHIRASLNGSTYDVIAANAQATLQCITTAPSAGPATVSGRVLTSSGMAVSRATVTLTDENGNSRSTVTNTMGFYSFSEVPSGKSYILNAAHKMYKFSPQVIGVDADLTADIVAN